MFKVQIVGPNENILDSFDNWDDVIDGFGLPELPDHPDEVEEFPFVFHDGNAEVTIYVEDPMRDSDDPINVEDPDADTLAYMRRD